MRRVEELTEKQKARALCSRKQFETIMTKYVPEIRPKIIAILQRNPGGLGIIEMDNLWWRQLSFKEKILQCFFTNRTRAYIIALEELQSEGKIRNENAVFYLAKEEK